MKDPIATWLICVFALAAISTAMVAIQIDSEMDILIFISMVTALLVILGLII